jgi:hypothetical protein
MICYMKKDFDLIGRYLKPFRCGNSTDGCTQAQLHSFHSNFQRPESFLEAESSMNHGFRGNGIPRRRVTCTFQLDRSRRYSSARKPGVSYNIRFAFFEVSGYLSPYRDSQDREQCSSKCENWDQRPWLLLRIREFPHLEDTRDCITLGAAVVTSVGSPGR